MNPFRGNRIVLIQYIAMFCIATMLPTACDDNTSELGIYQEADGITNSSQIFEITTRSVLLDSVIATTATNYVGNITDPETGTDISADFAAQFFVFEDYNFPAKNLMLGRKSDGIEAQGIVQCDSCELRLYFNKYYGEGNNPMKLEVSLLDINNILNEDSTYYTDIDLTQYLPVGSSPLATRMFTPMDYNLDDATLTSSSHTHNVPISLPTSLGQEIMEKYYANPDNFKDSYHFIRNVFPGLYIRTSNGSGSMLSVSAGTLNLYYHYADDSDEDTTYVGLTRFAATPEVIQSTHFSNGNMNSLLADKSCTYLKTPAGICTEMTLPIDELFSGSHATDSISLASVTLTRYNKQQDNYQLGTPAELLMVRKQEAKAFFAEHRVSDSRTSFTTSFSSLYNTYTFSNICRLLAYCKHEKISEAAAQGITEEQWALQNPDWNKVLLIPVTTSSNTSGVQVSVTHDLGLGSIRLVGGSTPLKMQVIYSKFFQE